MGLDGLDSLKRKLRRMESNLERKPQRAVERSAATITANMRANVAFEDAIASTELLNGIVFRRTAGGVEILSTAPYSGFVEFGTGPKHIQNQYTRHYSKPKFSGALVGALVDWVIVKPTLTLQPGQSPIGVARAVALAISGELDGAIGGTAAQPYFVPAWESGKPMLLSRVEDAVGDSIPH